VMAVTSLMKGLLGFVLPILVIGVYSCVEDGWFELAAHLIHGSLHARIQWLIERNRWLFNWRTSVAAPLALGLYIAPFAISHATSGSNQGLYMVYRENVERYFAAFDHRGPIYLYALVIFELMAPWSVFLPAAIVHSHSRATAARIATRSDRFVLTFFWTIFIFFTLSGSRRGYYILPILPAGAILIARVFVISERELSHAERWWLKFGFGLIVLVLIFSAAVLLPNRRFLPPPYSLLPMLPRPGIFASCWIISLISAAYACIRFSRERILLSVGVISYLLLFYLFVVALPAGDQWRGERQFAEATRQLVGQRDELAAFKSQPPVFYLRFAKPVPQYDSRAELASAVRNGHIRWIILRRRDIPALNIPARETVVEATYPWDSPEHRSNALVLMKLEPSAQPITSSASRRIETPSPRES
jgi:4-amino-4-deoxy-L-arabinose transferase-like glycosyltransferase